MPFLANPSALTIAPADQWPSDKAITGSNLIRIADAPGPTGGLLVVEGHRLARALKMLAEARPPVFAATLGAPVLTLDEEAPPRLTGIFAELAWLGALPVEPGHYTAVGYAFGGQCREWVAQRMKIRRRLTEPTIDAARLHGWGIARLLELAKLPVEQHAEQMRAWLSRDLRERGRVGSPSQAIARARDLVDDARRRLELDARRAGRLALFDFAAFDRAHACLAELLDSETVRGFPETQR